MMHMNPNFITVQIEDKPGQLGRLARCLAERDVNIETFQSSPGICSFITVPRAS